MDGWPIIGQVGADGIGGMVWHAQEADRRVPAGHDSRRATSSTRPALKPQWEWNYQPRPDKWSLTERPGFLRLHAFPPLHPGDFKKAGNTLTQRSLRTPHNEVTVKLDLSGMADGQQAGLVHYAGSWCLLRRRPERRGADADMTTTSGHATAGPTITQNALWLRSTWGYRRAQPVPYSLDGKTFLPFGDPYPLTWGDYRGDRIGLFTFNDAGEQGYVDMDWFHYAVTSQGGG